MSDSRFSLLEIDRDPPASAPCASAKPGTVIGCTRPAGHQGEHKGVNGLGGDCLWFDAPAPIAPAAPPPAPLYPFAAPAAIEGGKSFALDAPASAPLPSSEAAKQEAPVAALQLSCTSCRDTGVLGIMRCRCPIGRSLTVPEVMAGGRGRSLPPIEGRDHGPSAPVSLEELQRPAIAQQAPAAQPSLAAQAMRPASVAEGLVALELPGEMTGEVVFWTLSGDIAADKLAAAFAAEGLPAEILPQPSSPERALHRAAEQQRDAGSVVRKRPKGGWQIMVIATDADGELAATRGARILLNEEEEIVVEAPEGSQLAPALEAQVRASFAHHRTHITATDVSSWLVRIQASAVALRSTGGVYFTPRAAVEQLRKIKRALRACSAHTIYEIPAMKSAEAMVAVVDSLARECDETIAKIRQEVQDGELGKRAIATRIDEAAQLTKKVEGYERLLGRPLGEITAKLALLRGDLGKMTSRFLLLETE